MSDTDLIATDAQQLAQSNALISLFELEALGTTLYFHSENTDDSLEFDGNTYIAFPAMIEGIDINSDGVAARPTLSIPNVESLLKSDSTIAQELGTQKLDDLVGGRITRRQTLDKYLDPATPYEFPRDVFVIERIASKNQLLVQFELTSPFDFGGARVPNRVVTGKYCPWIYKGYTLSNIEVQSACSWTDSSQQKDSTNTYSLYFSIDDEPFLKETLSDVTSASAWSSSTAYTAGAFVTTDSGNLLWQARADGTNHTPSEKSIYWKLCRTFSVWSTDGLKSYTINAIDGRRNDYVYHNNNIWRCTKAHTRTSSIEPGNSPSYWVAGDICGKLISSCKARFQAKLHTNSGTGTDAYAQVAEFDTTQVLPFGGFPGTRKFR